MNEEMDVIQHLLEIEREASRTLIDAQTEADRKISVARAEADSQFKQRYAEITKSLESEAAAEKQRITDLHETELNTFKENLKSTEKNSGAFNALLEKLLFASPVQA